MFDSDADLVRVASEAVDAYRARAAGADDGEAGGAAAGGAGGARGAAPGGAVAGSDTVDEFEVDEAACAAVEARVVALLTDEDKLALAREGDAAATASLVDAIRDLSEVLVVEAASDAAAARRRWDALRSDTHPHRRSNELASVLAELREATSTDEGRVSAEAASLRARVASIPRELAPAARLHGWACAQFDRGLRPVLMLDELMADARSSRTGARAPPAAAAGAPAGKKKKMSNRARRAATVSAVFGRAAGISNVATLGLPVDEMGNGVGDEADLAPDGAFKDTGARVVLIALYNDGMTDDFSGVRGHLEVKGFEVEYFRSLPPVDALVDLLEGQGTQLWIISGSGTTLTPAHCDVIEARWRDGMGLYLLCDNEPFIGDFNMLATCLGLPNMTGNVPAGDYACVDNNAAAAGLQVNGPHGFLRRDHEITTGIQRLFVGITVATCSQEEAEAHGFDVILRVNEQENRVVTAYRPPRRAFEAAPVKGDKDHSACGPVAIEGAFTRLYVKTDTAGTKRFVTNVAIVLGALQGDARRERLVACRAMTQAVLRSFALRGGAPAARAAVPMEDVPAPSPASGGDAAPEAARAAPAAAVEGGAVDDAAAEGGDGVLALDGAFTGECSITMEEGPLALFLGPALPEDALADDWTLNNVLGVRLPAGVVLPQPVGLDLARAVVCGGLHDGRNPYTGEVVQNVLPMVSLQPAVNRAAVGEVLCLTLLGGRATPGVGFQVMFAHAVTQAVAMDRKALARVGATRARGEDADAVRAAYAAARADLMEDMEEEGGGLDVVRRLMLFLATQIAQHVHVPATFEMGGTSVPLGEALVFYATACDAVTEQRKSLQMAAAMTMAMTHPQLHSVAGGGAPDVVAAAYKLARRALMRELLEVLLAARKTQLEKCRVLTAEGTVTPLLDAARAANALAAVAHNTELGGLMCVPRGAGGAGTPTREAVLAHAWRVANDINGVIAEMRGGAAPEAARGGAGGDGADAEPTFGERRSTETWQAVEAVELMVGRPLITDDEVALLLGFAMVQRDNEVTRMRSKLWLGAFLSTAVGRALWDAEAATTRPVAGVVLSGGDKAPQKPEAASGDADGADGAEGGADAGAAAAPEKDAEPQEDAGAAAATEPAPTVVGPADWTGASVLRSLRWGVYATDASWDGKAAAPFITTYGPAVTHVVTPTGVEWCCDPTAVDPAQVTEGAEVVETIKHARNALLRRVWHSVRSTAYPHGPLTEKELNAEATNMARTTSDGEAEAAAVAGRARAEAAASPAVALYNHLRAPFASQAPVVALGSFCISLHRAVQTVLRAHEFSSAVERTPEMERAVAEWLVLCKQQVGSVEDPWHRARIAAVIDSYLVCRARGDADPSNRPDRVAGPRDAAGREPLCLSFADRLRAELPHAQRLYRSRAEAARA